MKQVFIGDVDIDEPKRVKLRYQGKKKWFWWTFKSSAAWVSFFKRWRNHKSGPVGFSPKAGRFYFKEKVQ